MDSNKNLRIVRTTGPSYPYPYKDNVLWVYHDEDNNPVSKIWDHGKWVPFAGEGSGDITIDTELNEHSTNPVQNKVITQKLSELETSLGGKAEYPIIEISTNQAAFSSAFSDSFKTQSVGGTVTSHTWDEIRKFIQNETPIRVLFDGLDIATPLEVHYQDAEDGYYSGIISTAEFRREFRIDHSLAVDITDTYGLQTFMFEVESGNVRQYPITTSQDTINACIKAFNADPKSVRVICYVNNNSIEFGLLTYTNKMLIGMASLPIDGTSSIVCQIALSENDGESAVELIEGGVDLSDYYTKEETNTKLAAYDLKDRAYVADQNMGYKVLDKDKSIISQMTEANTIYEIRYDFDLNGETLTVPENCTLKFEGGSLKNGSIVFNNTYLDGDQNINVLTEIQGNISNNLININWFGASTENGFDNSSILQKVIDITDSAKNTVYIPIGIYGIKKGLTFSGSKGYLIGESSTRSVLKAIADMDFMLGDETGNTYVSAKFKNFALDGGVKEPILDADNNFNVAFDSYAKSGINFKNYYYVPEFCNLRFINIAGTAVDIVNIWGVDIYNIFISNCSVGMHFVQPNGMSIKDCIFNTISDYAIFTRTSYTLDVTHNIFEIIGKCAILAFGFGTLGIRCNYFEDCCKTGLRIYDLHKVNYKDIHSNIILGNLALTLESEFINSGPYNSLITDISSNTFQENYLSDSDNNSIVFCSTGSLSVKNNSLRSKIDINLVGIALNSGVLIRNILVENNNIFSLNTDGYPTLVKTLYKIHCYWSDGYGYIKPFISDKNSNLMRHASISGLTSISKTGSNLNGKDIFTTSSDLTLIVSLNNKLLPAAITNLEEQVVLLVSYRKDSSSNWVHKSYLMRDTLKFDSITSIKAGYEFLPFEIYPLNNGVIYCKDTYLLEDNTNVEVHCIGSRLYTGKDITALSIDANSSPLLSEEIEEVFQFSTGASPTITITGVSWANSDVPTFEANKTYEIHIMYNSTLDRFLATYATYE